MDSQTTTTTAVVTGDNGGGGALDLALTRLDKAEPTTRFSPRSLARTAGAVYLGIIVTGLFAIAYVPAAIIVPGDAAATAQNVLGHPFLFRLGLAVHLVTVLLNLPLGVLLYDLLKIVDRRLALSGLFFILGSGVVEGVDLFVRGFAPLVLLDGAPVRNAFTTDQLQSLVYLSLANSTGPSAIGSATSLAFFSMFCLSTGYLIVRSTFLPRAVGVLMAIAGLSYLLNSFAQFLSPELASALNPFILLPSGIGEISFCLWLLASGANTQRWNERAIIARMTQALA